MYRAILIQYKTSTEDCMQPLDKKALEINKVKWPYQNFKYRSIPIYIIYKTWTLQSECHVGHVSDTNTRTTLA